MFCLAERAGRGSCRSCHEEAAGAAAAAAVNGPRADLQARTRRTEAAAHLLLGAAVTEGAGAAAEAAAGDVAESEGLPSREGDQEDEGGLDTLQRRFTGVYSGTCPLVWCVL